MAGSAWAIFFGKRSLWAWQLAGMTFQKAGGLTAAASPD